jgi:hypothetical protein
MLIGFAAIWYALSRLLALHCFIYEHRVFKFLSYVRLLNFNIKKEMVWVGWGADAQLADY